MGDAVVQDARGVILDANDDWNVISMSYRKFFNIDEALAADID